MATDPLALKPGEAAHPTGLGVALLAVTIVFTFLVLMTVGLRILVRSRTGKLGIDDYLMCIGTLLNMIHNGFVIRGVYAGIGSKDSVLSPALMSEATKMVLFWQIFYVTSSVFIKTSICAQIMRLTNDKRIHYVLLGIVFLSVAITLTAMISALVRCRPVAATWNPALGTCIPQNIIITLTYVVSAMNIVTDWSVAIVPAFILWNLQMRRTLKQACFAILGLGVLASIATIIRLPYSSIYSKTSNVLYGMANLILWTVIELSLGIIAGSVPMLRTLVRTFAKDESSYNQKPSNNHNLVTIGKISGRSREMYHHTTVVADDRDHSGDDESTKNIIRVTQRVDQVTTGGSRAYQHLP